MPHDVGGPLLVLSGAMADRDLQPLDLSLQSRLLLPAVGLELSLLPFETLVHGHQGTQLLQNPGEREGASLR